MHDLALVSSHSIRGLPPLLLEHCNDRGLSRAFDQAGLSEKILDGNDIFITQRSQLAFMQAAARELGESQLGLLLAPSLSLNSYGVWGKYILAGTTLKNTLLRSGDVMKYYSTHDSATLMREGDYIRYSFKCASTGIPGYQDVAIGAAAIIKHMVCSFLGHGWKPPYIELDLPNSRKRDHMEEVFGCPVRLGSNEITIPVPIEALNAPHQISNTSPVLTRADVVREARGTTPRKFPDVILELIRTQLMCGHVGLETTALDLQIGPRKLQRELEKDNTSYRNLVIHARTERAKELLLMNGLNITQISGELGYSSPTHFSRAFNSITGISPSRFRKLARRQRQSRV